MTNRLAQKINALMKKNILSKSEGLHLLALDQDPWEQARGIFKNQKIDAVKYQKKIRKEFALK